MLRKILLCLFALFFFVSFGFPAMAATGIITATTLTGTDTADAVFATKALQEGNTTKTATIFVGENPFLSRCTNGLSKSTGDIMVASCISCHENMAIKESHGTVARLEIPATVAITVLKEKRHGIGKDVAVIFDSTGAAPQPISAGMHMKTQSALASRRHGVGVMDAAQKVGLFLG